MSSHTLTISTLRAFTEKLRAQGVAVSDETRDKAIQEYTGLTVPIEQYLADERRANVAYDDWRDSLVRR